MDFGRYVRRRTVVLGAALVVLALAVGLTMAALHRPPPVAGPPGPSDGPGPDCVALLGESRSTPAQSRLLPGARVTNVVQCLAGEPGAVVRRQARTGLQPFVDTLTSDDARHFFWRTCDAVVSLIDWGQVWVRLDSGRWLLPRWPVDVCGVPQGDVYAALQALPFDPVETMPLLPLSTRVAPTCAEAAGDEPGVHPAMLGPDVIVTGAVLCRRDAAGVVVRSTADDVDALAAALRQPDIPERTCSAVAPDVGRLWLRLLRGTWIQPRWPQQPCGRFAPAALAALDATRFTG
jgi:hypothetical protein